jgi:hypothetical protein
MYTVLRDTGQSRCSPALEGFFASCLVIAEPAKIGWSHLGKEFRNGKADSEPSVTSVEDRLSGTVASRRRLLCHWRQLSQVLFRGDCQGRAQFEQSVDCVDESKMWKVAEIA